MTAQRMVGWKVAERKFAQGMMGRQMMRRRRRRGLLGEGVTSEAYGEHARDDEGPGHGRQPSAFVQELIVPYSR
jgi:hypothetical protein